MAKREPNYYGIRLEIRGNEGLVFLVYRDALKEREEWVNRLRGNRQQIIAKAEDIRLARQIEAPLKIR